MLKSGYFRIAFIYVVTSLLWIFFSDSLLFLFKNNLSQSAFLLLNSGKGFFFVAVTGVALFFLIRKNSRQKADAQNEYRELYESNPSPMWIYDPLTLKFISVNETATIVYGYSREEFLNMTIKDIRPAEDHDRLLKAVNLAGKFQKSGVWKHLKKDGTLMYVDVLSNKIHFRGQDAVMILARDHTQTIAAQELLNQANIELADEKKRLIDIQELSKIAAWDYFIADRKLVASDEVYKVFRVEKGFMEASYDLYLQIIHREDLNRFLSAVRVTMIHGKDLDIVHRLFISKQDIRYVRLLGKVEVRDGKPYKIRGTMQDITEIKQMEQEKILVDTENKMLDNIITKINNMVVILDTSSCITWVNKAYEDFTGYLLPEVIGLKPSSFMMGPDDKEQLNYIEEAESRRESFSVDTINYNRYNQPYWVNIEFTPMLDGGKFKGYITIHNDITVRKEKEDQITRQNIVLRNIAWMSSHEIRRPAASILGLMELIKTSTNQKDKDEYLRLLNDCTIQLDQIIHQINATIYEKLPTIEQ